MRTVGRFLLTAAVLSTVVLITTGARASEAKDYAYLFLQGRIETPSGGLPAVGATVRLVSGEQTFEAVTDSQGAFVFEDLPVTSFDLEITMADGKVIRGVKQLERFAADRARLEVSFSSKAGASRDEGKRQEVTIDAGPEQIAIGIPSPPTNWGRFWKQGVIFLGIALLLAL